MPWIFASLHVGKIIKSFFLDLLILYHSTQFLAEALIKTLLSKLIKWWYYEWGASWLIDKIMYTKVLKGWYNTKDTNKWIMCFRIFRGPLSFQWVDWCRMAIQCYSERLDNQWKNENSLALYGSFIPSSPSPSLSTYFDQVSLSCLRPFLGPKPSTSTH